MSHITNKEIESKIMRILMANRGKVLSHYDIYTELVDILDMNDQSLPADLKLRFLFILESLPSSYDDISIYKINKYDIPIYKVVYDRNKNHKIDFNNVSSLSDWPNMKSLNEYSINNNSINASLRDYNNKNTLLHDAISNNYSKNVIKKLLIQDKIDPLIENSDNITAIEYINNHEISNIFLLKLFQKIEEQNNIIKKL